MPGTYVRAAMDGAQLGVPTVHCTDPARGGKRLILGHLSYCVIFLQEKGCSDEPLDKGEAAH